jgi:hypothetical protein
MTQLKQMQVVAQPLKEVVGHGENAKHVKGRVQCTPTPVLREQQLHASSTAFLSMH